MGMGSAVGAGTGAGLEMVVSLIGQLVANGQRDQAEKLYDEMLQDAKGIDVPAFEDAIAFEIDKQKNVSADPAVREAQMGALSKMQGIADQQGLDPQAQLALQQARQSTDQQARANSEGIQSDMARRGMSGSGSELAGQMAGSQGASNRGNMAGLQTAADARERAMAALAGVGQMSGQIRGQDFTTDESNRRAAMERDRFNAGLKTAAQQSNINQRFARTNAQMGKLGALNKAKTAKAGRWDEGAQRTERAYSGVGRGLNKLATSAGEGYDAYSEGGGGGMGGMMGGM
jgi:hypothetical protein